MKSRSIEAVALEVTLVLMPLRRMMPQGKSDLTCIAFTVGTAILAVLQWLQDLRLDSFCVPL